jgi:Ser/Thr protein kinase RdoA (MazF antagonist)
LRNTVLFKIGCLRVILIGYSWQRNIPRLNEVQLTISQSTPTAASIAALVQSRYALDKIIESEFLRSGFNQVYKLSCENGQRVVARLSTARPRGEPNVLFESAVLEHLAKNQCAVACCLPASNGEFSIDVLLPEGTRKLMLFEYVDGESMGDTAEDIRAFAHGLANVHICGESYRGSASAYTLDLDHLLLRPLENLLRAPSMKAELRQKFETLGQKLRGDILELGTLSRVLCHGDAHDGNHFIVNDAQGKRHAVFFDFDDAGPGYLSYELAVYPWNLHRGNQDVALSDKSKEKWRHFIDAYREMKSVPEADIAAISCFMAVREIWLLGEYAAKASIWGSQAIPTDYLRRQAMMLQQWETLKL